MKDPKMKLNSLDISFENRAMMLLDLPASAADGPVLYGREHIPKTKTMPEGKKMFIIPPRTGIRIRHVGDRADLTISIGALSQIVRLDPDDEILKLAKSALDEIGMQI